MNQFPKTPQLPSPSEHPDSDVVIYDGQCVFCRSQVERLNRWDGKNRLSFLSLHDDQARHLCPDLSHDQLMEQMYIVTRSGHRYGGAAAARYLTRRLPRLWLAAPVMHIPFTLPIWQWMYMKVAERRYRLSGKDDCESGTCEIHFGKK